MTSKLSDPGLAEHFGESEGQSPQDTSCAVYPQLSPRQLSSHCHQEEISLQTWGQEHLSPLTSQKTTLERPGRTWVLLGHSKPAGLHEPIGLTAACGQRGLWPPTLLWLRLYGICILHSISST